MKDTTPITVAVGSLTVRQCSEYIWAVTTPAGTEAIVSFDDAEETFDGPAWAVEAVESACGELFRLQWERDSAGDADAMHASWTPAIELLF